jgi:hypothetical protein
MSKFSNDYRGLACGANLASQAPKIKRRKAV